MAKKKKLDGRLQAIVEYPEITYLVSDTHSMPDTHDEHSKTYEFTTNDPIWILTDDTLEEHIESAVANIKEMYEPEEHTVDTLVEYLAEVLADTLVSNPDGKGPDGFAERILSQALVASGKVRTLLEFFPELWADLKKPRK